MIEPIGTIATIGGFRLIFLRDGVRREMRISREENAMWKRWIFRARKAATA